MRVLLPIQWFNYALNVKPNPNQTASEFKVAMVKKLLNGELLVIRDNDKFYIADNFVDKLLFRW
ncbi:hypothetical protein GCM10017706_31700 [Lactococcus lactis subsp. hordniae]